MSSIAPPVLSVLELFKGPLAGMRFADVDAQGLASLVTQVDAAHVEVADAEAKLAELQQSLAVQQEALLVFAQRALAYARVFAEGQDELLTQLNGIALPRLAKPRKASPAPPAEARAVEPDPERIETGLVSDASGASAPTIARKSRCGRAAMADAAAEGEHASASE